jgi:hypothetical protein
VERAFGPKVSRTFPQPIPITPQSAPTGTSATPISSTPEENGVRKSESSEDGISKPSDNGPNDLDSDPSEEAPPAEETQLHSASSSASESESSGGINSGPSGLVQNPTLSSASGSGSGMSRPVELPKDRVRLNWGRGTIYNSLTPAQQERARQTPKEPAPKEAPIEFLTFEEHAKKEAMKLLQYTMEKGITADELIKEFSNKEMECGKHTDMDGNYNNDSPPSPPHSPPSTNNDNTHTTPTVSSKSVSDDTSSLTDRLTDRQPTRNLNPQFRNASSSLNQVVKYSPHQPELYDLKEFAEEVIPDVITDDVRRQVVKILREKIDKVNMYMKELERYGPSYITHTKFDKGTPFETWKLNFITEISILPFGKYFYLLQKPLNPRKQMNPEIFNSPYGQIKVNQYASKLDIKLKELITRIGKCGFRILHKSVSQNTDCMNILTSLHGMDYFESMSVIHKRFAPFQEAEKERLITKYTHLRISPGQSFRQFYGTVLNNVHELHQLHNVQMNNEMVIHKLATNLPDQLRPYYFQIKGQYSDPEQLANALSEYEDLVLISSKAPETANVISEKSGKSRFKGRCTKCGHFRHRASECTNPKPPKDYWKNRKSANSSKKPGNQFQQESRKPQNYNNQKKNHRNNNTTTTGTGKKNFPRTFHNRKRKSEDISEDMDHGANMIHHNSQGTQECLICHQRNNHSYTDCPYGQMTIQVENEVRLRHDEENAIADNHAISHSRAFMIVESVLPATFISNQFNNVHQFTYFINNYYNSQHVVVDTGATRSMFRDRTLFDNYTLVSDTYVYTANGKPLEVVGKGSVGLISDCFHIPALSRDLLSIPHLDATLGISASFSKGEITISSASKQFPTLKGTLNPQTMLYEVPISQLVTNKRVSNIPQSSSHALLLQSKAEAVNRLHDIFHRDSRRLEQMIKDGVISWDVPYKPTNFIRMQSECDACRIAKSTRKSFPGHIPPETQIGKLWYFDMWGPNETASIKGNTYIAGFIEAVTKKVFLYYLPNKKCATVTRHLVTTEIPVLRHRHGLKDFIIQSDTGEFVSREIEQILAENGGVLRHSSPYTPETQSVIERLWRTVTELATTMLLAAKLPEPYWEDATEYARLIYNRTIRSTGSPDIRQSPEEMYTSAKPSMKHYQPFGCKAFLHIPKAVRRKNHKGRAELGIFVGFDEQTYPGYKFYRPLYRDYVITAHCRFAKWVRRSLQDELSPSPDNPPISEGSIEDFIHLKDTYHIDSDDGLLYETTRVEEKSYPGVGKLLVGYRRRILPNGTPEKEEKDPVHIRNIEEMTNNTDEDILERTPVLELSSPAITHVDHPNLVTPPEGRVTPGAQHSRMPKATTTTHNRPPHAAPKSASAQVKQKPNKDSPPNRGKMVQITIGRGAPRTTTTKLADKRPGDALTSPNAKRLRNPPERLAFLVSSPLQNSELSEEDAYSEDSSQLYALSVANGDGLALLAVGNPSGSVEEFPEPQTHDEAMAGSDANQWQQAEAEEMDSIQRLNMLSEPMPLPSGCKPVGLRWVYKKKRNSLGEVTRYRARLVAKGFQQTFGLDYFDTYSPVARLSSLRLLYALSVELNLQLAAMDVDAAFLNADLTEDIYIRAPPGQPELPKGYVYKLLKSLYGLKQSPKSWNDTLNQFLTTECKLRRLQSESCLYVRTDSNTAKCILVAVYVDDIVIAYNDNSLFSSFRSKIMTRFQCKNLGSLSRVLNMDILRTREGGLYLTQESYVNAILERFQEHITKDSNPTRLPFDPYLKLHKNGSTKGQHDHSSKYTVEEGAQLCPSTVPYRAVLGSLLWLAQGTRPDIAYAVTQCAKYAQAPRHAHWCALKKILQISTWYSRIWNLLYKNLRQYTTPRRKWSTPS